MDLFFKDACSDDAVPDAGMEMTTSAPYSPTSPAYAPTSPIYSPTTPAYSPMGLTDTQVREVPVTQASLPQVEVEVPVSQASPPRAESKKVSLAVAGVTKQKSRKTAKSAQARKALTVGQRRIY